MGRPEETGSEMVPAEPTAEKLWTVREVADFLSMSVHWVYKRVEDGTIPYAKLGARALRFHPARIREYAAKMSGAGAKVIPLRRGR